MRQAVTFGIVIPTAGRKSLSRTLESMAGTDIGLTPEDEVWIGVDGFENDLDVRAMVDEVADRIAAKIYVIPFPFAGDYGNSVRNRILGIGQGRGGISPTPTTTHIVYMDDDDIFAPDALRKIHHSVSVEPQIPHMFRFIGNNGHAVWMEEGRLEVGWVGGHGFVPPNDPKKLAPWGDRYEGDFDHISGTAKKFRGLIWVDEVIAECRPLSP